MFQKCATYRQRKRKHKNSLVRGLPCVGCGASFCAQTCHPRPIPRPSVHELRSSPSISSFLAGRKQEDGACQDCMYNVSCTGTLSGLACDLSLPLGETSDGGVTLASEELVTGDTYTLRVRRGRTRCGPHVVHRCRRASQVIRSLGALRDKIDAVWPETPSLSEEVSVSPAKGRRMRRNDDEPK